MELSVAQAFEQERLLRVIDSATDLEELKGLTKQLLRAWQAQRAATTWAIRQAMPTAASWGQSEAR